MSAYIVSFEQLGPDLLTIIIFGIVLNYCLFLCTHCTEIMIFRENSNDDFNNVVLFSVFQLSDEG